MARDKTQNKDRMPVSSSEIRYVFTALLRRPDLMQAAVKQLTPACFVEGEEWLARIWETARSHYEEFGDLPAKQEMYTLLNSVLERAPESFPPGAMEKANRFVNTVYNFDPESVNDKVVCKWLRRFLEDRQLNELRQKLMTGMSPSNLTQMFDDYTQRAGQIASIDAGRVASPFPEGWSEDRPIVIHPTGVSWADYFMGGGFSMGESYGLLGPYGGGKTTAGVMLTVEEAVRAYTSWNQDQSQPLKLSYHFSYEAPPSELRERALSYLAKIPRSRIRAAIVEGKGEWLQRLGDVGTIHDYERKHFSAAIDAGQFFCEQHRAQRALRILSRCWRIIQMDGNDTDNPGRGSGLVDEVASIVQSDQTLARQLGHNVAVGTVLVDYVLCAAERYLDATGTDHSELRHIVDRWPMNMKTKVAGAFDCHVWSLHQLNTNANAYSPGTVPKATDSAEGRGFNQNTDFTLMLGRPTIDGRQVLACTKHRRMKEKNPIVVHLDGGLARIRNVSDMWVVDTARRKILKRDEATALNVAAPTDASAVARGAIDDLLSAS